MSAAFFIDKENISTLWDVISDENIFKYLPKKAQNEVFELFTENIKLYHNFAINNKLLKLIDINKKYILFILKHIKETYPQQTFSNKIKILDEVPSKEIITSEDIQLERKTQFEKDVIKRQEEFENIMNVKTPPQPVFLDKYDDKPIDEMDKIIKEMTSSRNYEVEQINRSYNSDINQVNNWLKSQDTSVKTDKFMTNEVIHKKTVSWNDANNYDNDEDNNNDNDDNIFNKLKKISSTKIIENSKNSKLDELTYEDRFSNLDAELSKLNNKIDLIINLLNLNK